MTTMTATYDDGFLFVLWTATGVLDDYGVPGSPRWWSPKDPEIHTITIMAEDMEYDHLPKYLTDVIDEKYEELEWVLD